MDHKRVDPGGTGRSFDRIATPTPCAWHQFVTGQGLLFTMRPTNVEHSGTPCARLQYCQVSCRDVGRRMLHGHARVTSCNVNTFSLRLLYLLLCYREKWRCADLQTFSPLKSTNFDQRSASIRNPGSSESPRPQMTSPEMRAMQFIGGTLSTRYSLIDNNNHHNNNSPICKAPECQNFCGAKLYIQSLKESHW